MGPAILKKTWFRVLISLGLMALLIIFFVDIDAALAALYRCRWEYLAILFLWHTADRFLMAYKWRLLITCRGLLIGGWEAVKAYYLASFAGCFLPSTLGADAIRVASVTGPERPSTVLAASVVIERALGFVSSALAALFGLLILANTVADLPEGFLFWSLMALGAATAAVLASLSGLAGRPLDWLYGKLEGRGKPAMWLGEFLRSYHAYRRHRGVLTVFLILSLLEQAAPILSNWLGALALGIPLTLAQAAAVTPLAILFARLPVGASSLGVVEGIYVAFFALVGLSATDSFLLGFLFNLMALVSTLPGLAVYLAGDWRRGKNRRGTAGAAG